MHTKTKHIAIKCHYLRELVQDKEVKMKYVIMLVNSFVLLISHKTMTLNAQIMNNIYLQQLRSHFMITGFSLNW